jgi:uncharacterized RmlC-like cupin family protein
MADRVRRVSHDELQAGPPTPGMDRRQAFAADDAWFGEVAAEPETISGWHHHGEHTTYGRVLGGAIRFEFGAGGSEAIELGPGDFFEVPPHTVHREGNPGTEQALVILARVGSGDTAPTPGRRGDGRATDPGLRRRVRRSRGSHGRVPAVMVVQRAGAKDERLPTDAAR